MSSVIDAGLCVRTNQIDFDEEVVFAAERAHLRPRPRRRKRPFCMVVSLTHPHDPFAIPERYWNLYRDEDIDLPRLGSARCRSRRMSSGSGMSATWAAPRSREAHIRNARRAYYGAISYVDDNIGRLLSALRATGLADDTIVIVTSDHGEMLGERGFWYKMSFFEGAARVPLLVHAPGLFAARRVAALPSRSSTCCRRLVELARTDAPATMPREIDGRSLLPHLSGSDGHDEVVGEYLAEGAIAPIVMIRRGRWKFVHSPADPDQLYDLAADPRRAAQPCGRRQRSRHRRRLPARGGIALGPGRPRPRRAREPAAAPSR